MATRFLNEEETRDLREPSKIRFLSENELTPSGLPKFEPLTGTGEFEEMREQVPEEQPSLAQTAQQVAGGIAKSVGGALAQPEVSIPAAASIAAGIVAPPIAPLASEVAAIGVGLERLREEVGEAPETPLGQLAELSFERGLAGARFLTSAARIGAGLQSEAELPPPTESEQALGEIPELRPLVLISRIARSKPGELTRQLAKRGAIEAAFDSMGLLAVGGINRFRGRRGLITGQFKGEPVTAEAAKVRPVFQQLGLDLNAAQLTKGATLDLADKAARAGITGRNIIEGVDVTKDIALRKASDELGFFFNRDVGRNLTRRDLSKLLQGRFDVGTTASEAISELLYETVDELSGGTIVKRFIPNPTDPSNLIPILERQGGIQVSNRAVKNFGTQQLSKLEKTGVLAKDDPIRQRFSAIFGSFEDASDFSTAQELRSNLLQIGRETKNPGVKSFVREAEGLVDSAMEQAAKEGSPQLLRSWRKANAFFKRGKQTFEDAFNANLFLFNKKAEEEIGKQIFSSGKVENVIKTKRWLKLAEKRSKLAEARGLVDNRGNPIKAFDREKALKNIQENFMVEWTQRRFRVQPELETGGTVDWSGILNDIKTDRNFRETLIELSGESTVKDIERFAEAGAFAHAKSPISAGALSLMQAAAIVRPVRATLGAVTKPGPGAGQRLLDAFLTSTGLIRIPEALAKFLVSPKGIKFATEGLENVSKRTTAKVQLGIANILRGVGTVLNEEVQDRSKRFFFAQPSPEQEQEFGARGGLRSRIP